MVTVAFDVDGTLIKTGRDYPDVPRYDVIDILRRFQKMSDVEVFIWSGGGIPYAQHWADKLGLYCPVVAKGSFQPDIAFDDEQVLLGKVNIQV